MPRTEFDLLTPAEFVAIQQQWVKRYRLDFDNEIRQHSHLCWVIAASAGVTQPLSSEPLPVDYFLPERLRKKVSRKKRARSLVNQLIRSLAPAYVNDTRKHGTK